MAVRLALSVLLLLAALPASARTCALSIGADDAMRFDQAELHVAADCDEVVLSLHHRGTRPVRSMGHNWVLVAAEDLRAVAAAGMRASAAEGYLPRDDARVIAATGLIGGGETTTVRFSTRTLVRGGDYRYFCSFPGHWNSMQGRLVFGR